MKRRMNMKKHIVAFSAALLAGALTFTLAGCGMFGSDPDANYPYDIATEHGFDGSEASWLASLDTPSTHERKLYEEACENGYTGSYTDFLREIGAANQDDTVGVQTALRSVVAIDCRFDVANGFYASVSLSMGAGVIYSLDSSGNAYVVTNYHVVFNAGSMGREQIPHISDDISLYLYGSNYMGDGSIGAQAISATYLGGSMDYDVAVLKVTGSAVVTEDSGNTHTNRDVLARSGATAIVGANSDAITVGQRVYAIGNADGDGIAVSGGVVSVDAEYITIQTADETRTVSMLEIRTDAAVNHGNSGGGLFDAEGSLIGLVNARSEADGVVAFGYAIPANLALSVAQNIIDNASDTVKGARRATIGVSVGTYESRSVYDAATAKYYIEEKVIVAAVTDTRTPGYRAGLRVGDTIVTAAIVQGGTAVRTVDVTRRHKLTNLLFEVRLGDTLRLTVTREGSAEPLVIDVTFSAGDFVLYS